MCFHFNCNMASCCLCRDPVASDHRKRKKIQGPGCVLVRDVLEELAGVSLQVFLTMRDAEAVLCHTCELTLKNIKKFEEKVACLKTDIKEKISALEKATVKRSCSDDPTNRSQAKHLRVETSSSCTAADTSELTGGDSDCVRGSVDEDEHHTVTPVTVSPNVQVLVSYPSGTQRFKIKTPSRKMCVKRLTRKSYASMASTLVNSPRMCGSVIRKLATKIKAEMKSISSNDHDSILRDTIEAVKHFHWDTVMLELLKKVPTLMNLLKQLVNRPAEKKPLLCFIASQLLKSRHQHMGLVQRAVSIMMYGNGTSKQVFSNLQPLNVCMSYQRTIDLVSGISQDHDIEVQFWKDELMKLVKDSPQIDNSAEKPNRAPLLLDECDPEDDIEAPPCVILDECDPEDDIEAPPYSPISIRSTDSNYDCDSMDVCDPMSDDGSETESNASDELLQHEEDSAPIAEEKDETWFGYKFVGDNVDKNVKPSFQRQEGHKGQSLHHFHGYAVRDRVNVSTYSDAVPPYVTPDPSVLLPSSEDLSALKDELTVLVSRILTHYMDDFKHEAKTVPAHIPSKQAKEMASRSDVIPLGVLLFNENKLDEMSHILDHYMTLVPTVEIEGHHKLPNGSEIDFDDTRFFSIIFGGDQLTVARMRGVQALRDTHSKRADRFEGLIPVVEDWHARMTVMKVLWGRLYKTTSSTEKGTMYQLRNLIHRTNVPADPEKNMNAAEDFMLLMLHTHVVAAAKLIQELNPVESVHQLAKSILVNFARFPTFNDSPSPNTVVDGVNLYATELLSLGLIWHGFHDAVREGDGERILRYWKFLLVLFKCTNHRNYAKEAVNLLVQYYYTLSERQKAQLLWCRCVNTRGCPGGNIPCDLHMEHLNRRLKSIIRGMGANVNAASIEKAGKAIAAVHRVCQVFERQTAPHQHSDHHPIPSFGEDFNKVLELLEEEQVFVPVSSRAHKSFKFSCGLMENQSIQQLAKKVQANIAKL